MHLQHSVNIRAAKEKIWSLLTDVENWKQWDQDVKFAQLDGQFTVGTKGTLFTVSDSQSIFYITEIEKYHHYANFYQYPLFTKLKFTHVMVPQANGYKVTFLAQFTGLFAWYFARKENETISRIMQNALTNLSALCEA